jgi:Spy/CpxP family protein refolding chaperone
MSTARSNALPMIGSVPHRGVDASPHVAPHEGEQRHFGAEPREAAPEIDREAAERLRAEKIETIDRASRRMTDALIEAAEVLTPEQRAALIEKFEERRWHRRR